MKLICPQRTGWITPDGEDENRTTLLLGSAGSYTVQQAVSKSVAVQAQGSSCAPRDRSTAPQAGNPKELKSYRAEGVSFLDVGGLGF